jgi:hypothetical protein
VAVWAARRHPAWAAGLLIAGGTGVQLALWRLYPYGLAAIVRSDAATSYFSAALRYDAATLLRRYDTFAPTLPLHAAGNMPGKILLFQALHALGASPDAMAVLILVLGNLVGVLVLLVALDLLGDRAAAAGAMALWVFLPVHVVFAPVLNVVAPIVVTVAAGLWRSRRALSRPAAWIGAGGDGVRRGRGSPRAQPGRGDAPLDLPRRARVRRSLRTRGPQVSRRASAPR